jgi:putative membrane protein insertion efficiency factor
MAPVPLRAQLARLAAIALLVAGLATCGQTAALHLIRSYQRTLAPVANSLGLRCRFSPSCSEYGEAVIRRDGLVVGGWRTLGRIARCGPWTRAGTVDQP